jgi:hypothetical protein
MNERSSDTARDPTLIWAIRRRAGHEDARRSPFPITVRGATLVDAIVMASAARAGAIVYTSDFDDLSRLQAYFPTVRVFSVQGSKS